MYFDNVGGEISAAVHARLALHARIVICGQVSQYNAEAAGADLRPARADRLPRAHGGLPGQRLRAPLRRGGACGWPSWVAEGTIRWREHVTEGLENAPAAFIGMLNGENRGKALVRVASRD